MKTIISFAKLLGNNTTLYEITKKEQIISFLDTKIQSTDKDPDKRWITTWNDYLGRIKFFVRWLYNYYKKKSEGQELLFSTTDWVTPSFVQIRKKTTKRISPYIEDELWERDDIITIINYEPYKRNKAALALLWDLDARNHEITLLRIKHIRLKNKDGEREIPHEAKTGTGPSSPHLI